MTSVTRYPPWARSSKTAVFWKFLKWPKPSCVESFYPVGSLHVSSQHAGLLSGRISSLARSSAFLYRDRPAFPVSCPHKPPTNPKKKIPRQTKPSTRNWAGFGIFGGEIAGHFAVQGRGFDSGSREARVPIPRILTHLDTPESTNLFELPSHPALTENKLGR